MKEHFGGTTAWANGTFRFVPQLWRTFESEVHLVPTLHEPIAQAGVYRKDLDSNIFNPAIA